MTDKYTIGGSCKEESTEKPVNYYWFLYIKDTSIRKRRDIPTPIWRNVQNLTNMTDTELTNKFIVIKPNTLLGGRRYRLMMTAKMYGRTTARVINEFVVNAPPYGGKCTVDLPSGLADLTNFTFNCHGWKDDDTPLTYEFNYRNSYGLLTMIYFGLKNAVTTKLPVGDPDKDFISTVVVRVFDSLRAFVQFEFDVKVRVNS